GGEAPRDAMWRLMVVAAIAAFHVLGIDLGASEFFGMSASAIAIALLFQAWRVAPTIPADVRLARSERDLATWVARSFKMWLSALMDTSNQYLEVVVIGFFLGP